MHGMHIISSIHYTFSSSYTHFFPSSLSCAVVVVAVLFIFSHIFRLIPREWGNFEFDGNINNNICCKKTVNTFFFSARTIEESEQKVKCVENRLFQTHKIMLTVCVCVYWKHPSNIFDIKHWNPVALDSLYNQVQCIQESYLERREKNCIYTLSVWRSCTTSNFIIMDVSFFLLGCCPNNLFLTLVRVLHIMVMHGKMLQVSVFFPSYIFPACVFRAQVIFGEFYFL